MHNLHLFCIISDNMIKPHLENISIYNRGTSYVHNIVILFFLKIFQGNSDATTVINYLPSQIWTSRIKIRPKTWSSSGLGLKFDVIGCWTSERLENRDWLSNFIYSWQDIIDALWGIPATISNLNAKIYLKTNLIYVILHSYFPDHLLFRHMLF